ncbi:MAG: hypothetical protein ACOCV8_06030, partial [Spirochaetota bacterium]
MKKINLGILIAIISLFGIMIITMGNNSIVAQEDDCYSPDINLTISVSSLITGDSPYTLENIRIQVSSSKTYEEEERIESKLQSEGVEVTSSGLKPLSDFFTISFSGNEKCKYYLRAIILKNGETITFEPVYMNLIIEKIVSINVEGIPNDTNKSNIEATVKGNNLVKYKYRVNNGEWKEKNIANNTVELNIKEGENTVEFVGIGNEGLESDVWSKTFTMKKPEGLVDTEEIDITEYNPSETPPYLFILRYAATRDSNAFKNIPIYLKNALNNLGKSKREAAKVVFKYVSSEDMEKIILSIKEDATNIYGDDYSLFKTLVKKEKMEKKEVEEETEDDKREAEEEEQKEQVYDKKEEIDKDVYGEGAEYAVDYVKVKDRRKEEEDSNKTKLYVYNTDELNEKEIAYNNFIRQLSGIEYNYNGFPLRDERGNYRKTFTSEWMKKVAIEKINIEYLTEALLKGLYNRDPVVRLECLEILRAMGPHPIMLDDLIKASGREIEMTATDDVAAEGE